MTRTCAVAYRQRRRGLTRIEVIVLILILGLLACFFVPATRSSRRAARKVQCLSDMRNIALAMHNYGSDNSGELLPLVSKQSITNSSGQQGTMTAPWPLLLLPALDNAARLMNIRNNAVIVGDVATINLEPGFDNVTVYGFTCADSPAYKQPGGLSFIVNAGHMPHGIWGTATNNAPDLIDWYEAPSPGDANDIEVGLATGVVWPEGYVSSLEYVATGDGISTTILLTENLQAGNWYDTQTSDLGFGVQLPVSLEASYPNAGATTDLLMLKQAPSSDNWFINRNRSAARGNAPRPSSNHHGGVNVVMADGSAKFLSENMDKAVFMKLVTPNGIAYGEQKLSASAFR